MNCHNNFDKNLILRYFSHRISVKEFSPFCVKIFITKYTKVFFARKISFARKEFYLSFVKEIDFVAATLGLPSFFDTRKLNAEVTLLKWDGCVHKVTFEVSHWAEDRVRRIHSDSWHALNRFDGNEKTHRGEFSSHWRRHRLDYLFVVNSVIAKFCEKISEIYPRNARLGRVSRLTPRSSLSPVWYSAVVCIRRYNPSRYTRFNPSLNPTSGDSYNVSAEVRSFSLTCLGCAIAHEILLIVQYLKPLLYTIMPVNEFSILISFFKIIYITWDTIFHTRTYVILYWFIKNPLYRIVKICGAHFECFSRNLTSHREISQCLRYD